MNSQSSSSRSMLVSNIAEFKSRPYNVLVADVGLKSWESNAMNTLNVWQNKPEHKLYQRRDISSLLERLIMSKFYIWNFALVNQGGYQFIFVKSRIA